MVGVSPDEESAQSKFIDKYDLPFELLSDPARKMMEKYGAWGEKVMYGQTKMGVIRSTVWIGADGKVRKHWKRVSDAQAHPKHVLEAIRAGRTS